MFGKFYSRKDRVAKFIMWRGNGQKIECNSFRKQKPKNGKEEMSYLADFFDFILLRMGQKDYSKYKVFIKSVTNDEFELLEKYLEKIRKNKN